MYNMKPYIERELKNKYDRDYKNILLNLWICIANYCYSSSFTMHTLKHIFRKQ